MYTNFLDRTDLHLLVDLLVILGLEFIFWFKDKLVINIFTHSTNIYHASTIS